MKPIILIAAFVLGSMDAVLALPLNFIETTTYFVGKDTAGIPQHLTTTDYIDGIGRTHQTKMRLAGNRDLTTCTFYDDLGRATIATKPFVDFLYNGRFLPGMITDPWIKNQLENCYPYRGT